ncbi:MAG: ribbon-helix-helix domain-containing protein [Promethearchaeota archaeon]
MKVITINLPEKYLKAIQVLKNTGRYQSRSDFIRVALKDFLLKELKMYNDLKKENFLISIKKGGI